MHHSWKNILSKELKKPYIEKIKIKVEESFKTDLIYPSKDKILRVFDLTSYYKVKAVIVGQDPYHGPGQANGLAFAVEEDKKIPPSLRNIFKEIESECGKKPESSSLEGWASQGVFLLNSILTVKHKSPSSHKHFGWERFTNATIEALNEREEPLAFLLWGNYARSKRKLINSKKHLVLESVHPSPFSAHKGFFGCGHFNKVNSWLQERNKEKINWTKS